MGTQWTTYTELTSESEVPGYYYPRYYDNGCKDPAYMYPVYEVPGYYYPSYYDHVCKDPAYMYPAYEVPGYYYPRYYDPGCKDPGYGYEVPGTRTMDTSNTMWTLDAESCL